MSVLTKVFVVLVTVLSVALLALLVPLVVNQQNYRAERDLAVTKAKTQEATAQVLRAELGIKIDEAGNKVAVLEAEKEALRAVVSAAKSDLANETARAESEKNRAAKMETSVATLSAQVSQLGEIIKAQKDELDKRRDRVVELDKEKIVLDAKNNELQARYDAQVAQIRRMKEEQSLTGEQLTAIRGMWARVPQEIRQQIEKPEDAAGASVSPVPEQRIEGAITGVQITGNETFVQINVGKNDRVLRNMKFLVYRGNDFLGNLYVIAVDERTAAGKIDLLQKPVQKGDKVLAGPDL